MALVRGGKETQLPRGLWVNGDEHRGTGVTMSTVRTALFRWPDRAHARCGELRRRRAAGGVKRVGTVIVAKFGTVWQSGKQARMKQSAWQHSERIDTQAGIADKHGHRVNSALRLTNVQISCLACCSW